MSDKNYIIVPSVLNPKFGVVHNIPASSDLLSDKSIKNPSEEKKQRLLKDRTGFTCDITEIDAKTFLMQASHPFHCLSYDIKLEVGKNEDHMGYQILCYFKELEIDSLNYFVDDDEFLFGSLFIQFQIQVMNELLKFCDSKKIENLIIYVDTEYLPQMAIFEDIVIAKKSMGSTSSKSKVIIDSSPKSLNFWQEMMKDMSISLREELWREQKTNYIAREYLKLEPFNDVFI